MVPSGFDDYLANVGEPQRAEFERIRRIVHETVPGLREVISYKMPGFAHGKTCLIWVGVFKQHMSLFPGTIRFTPDELLPEATIKNLLLERLAETAKR